MALAILSASLCAAPSAFAAMPPADAGTQLQFSVNGHITPKCSLTIQGSDQASFGAIMDGNTGHSNGATLDLPFSLECNSPYTATLTSKNGGLQFDGSAAQGFDTLVAYDARIGLSAAAGGLDLSCDSKEMHGANVEAVSADKSATQCEAASNGRGYSAGDGKVKLTLRNSGLLLKGTYSDELILRVSPNV